MAVIGEKALLPFQETHFNHLDFLVNSNSTVERHLTSRLEVVKLAVALFRHLLSQSFQTAKTFLALPFATEKRAAFQTSLHHLQCSKRAVVGLLALTLCLGSPSSAPSLCKKAGLVRRLENPSRMQKVFNALTKPRLWAGVGVLTTAAALAYFLRLPSTNPPAFPVQDDTPAIVNVSQGGFPWGKIMMGTGVAFLSFLVARCAVPAPRDLVRKEEYRQLFELLDAFNRALTQGGPAENAAMLTYTQRFLDKNSLLNLPAVNGESEQAVKEAYWNVKKAIQDRMMGDLSALQERAEKMRCSIGIGKLVMDKTYIKHRDEFTELYRKNWYRLRGGNRNSPEKKELVKDIVGNRSKLMDGYTLTSELSQAIKLLLLFTPDMQFPPDMQLKDAELQQKMTQSFSALMGCASSLRVTWQSVTHWMSCKVDPNPDIRRSTSPSLYDLLHARIV